MRFLLSPLLCGCMPDSIEGHTVSLCVNMPAAGATYTKSEMQCESLHYEIRGSRLPKTLRHLIENHRCGALCHPADLSADCLFHADILKCSIHPVCWTLTNHKTLVQAWGAWKRRRGYG